MTNMAAFYRTPVLELNTCRHIAIMGDTHGDGRAVIAGLKFARAHGVELVLHVGDFGGYNDKEGSAYCKAVSRQLSLYGQRMLITFGNHDDYSTISALEGTDQPTLEIGERLEVFNRPAAFSVNGKTGISFSGATSINRRKLRENIDWWPQERIGLGDLYRLEAMVAGMDEIDFMITHDAPIGKTLDDALNELRAEQAARGWSFSPEDEAYAQESQVAVERAVGIAQPKNLFHGHHHLRYTEVFGNTLVQGLSMNGMSGNTVIVDTEDFSVIDEWSRPF